MDAEHVPRAPRENREVDEAPWPGLLGRLRCFDWSDAIQRGSRDIADPALVGSVEDSSRQLLRRVILQESRIAQAS
jgi:hypothetical protein